jgi:hypothetical protein
MTAVATVPIPQPFNLAFAQSVFQARQEARTVLMQDTLVVSRVNPMTNLCFVSGFC